MAIHGVVVEEAWQFMRRPVERCSLQVRLETMLNATDPTYRASLRAPRSQVFWIMAHRMTFPMSYLFKGTSVCSEHRAP